MEIEDKTEQTYGIRDIGLSGMGFMGIIGVGRGGIRAINMMHEKGIQGAKYLICDTDDILLRKSSVNCKIHIEDNHSLSEQTKDQLKRNIQGVRILFLVAGMGGDMGANFLPEILETVKLEDVLIISILSVPFSFEGTDKIERAKHGIEIIRNLSNSVFELNSQLIMDQYPGTKLSGAFTKLHTVQFELITSIDKSLPWNGYLCSDCSDFIFMFKNSRYVVAGTGISVGENRITKAIDIACKFPPFDDKNIHTYNTVYLMIHCSTEHQLKMEEVEQIHSFIDGLKENISFTWAACFNDELAGKVEVVLIAGRVDNKHSKIQTNEYNL